MIFGKLVCGIWLVRFNIRLPWIASSRVLRRVRAMIKAVTKHKPKQPQHDTSRSHEQTATESAVVNASPTPVNALLESAKQA